LVPHADPTRTDRAAAHDAGDSRQAPLAEVTIMAATPIAVVAYDFWDALRALDARGER
jgi:hypothetical protein